MIHHGDLFDVLPLVAEASLDACVTDPPYGIGFMGKEWDSFSPAVLARKTANHPGTDQRTHSERAASMHAGQYDLSTRGQRGFQVWTERWAREVHRVLKPGAYLVVCGAPRSHHRMMCGLEDAGFVVRDCFAWLFGSGFPKNYNLGDGKGTALKPAHEPIALAWKPFPGSIKACHAQHGTAALHIDACRLPAPGEDFHRPVNHTGIHEGWDRPWKHDAEALARERVKRDGIEQKAMDLGRWPANVLLDEEAAAILDEQTGQLTTSQPGTSSNVAKFSGSVYNASNTPQKEWGYGDAGGASRFYYVAKPSREERDYGCEDLPQRSGGEACEDRAEGSAGLNNPRAGAGRTGGARNIHPTVKPVELMRWLVKLVTPIGGTVLDPFTGSGTTGMACRYEQRGFLGIEREAEYVAIAERRIAAVCPLFAGDVA